MKADANNRRKGKWPRGWWAAAFGIGLGLVVGSLAVHVPGPRGSAGKIDQIASLPELLACAPAGVSGVVPRSWWAGRDKACGTGNCASAESNEPPKSGDQYPTAPEG
jgi:hypothetical protein